MRLLRAVCPHLILVAGALAALAIPSALAPALASADVQRYEAADVRWHGYVYGQDQNGPFSSDETITGSYDSANKTITFKAWRPDGFSWTLKDAKTDSTTPTTATIGRTRRTSRLRSDALSQAGSDSRRAGLRTWARTKRCRRDGMYVLDPR